MSIRNMTIVQRIVAAFSVVLVLLLVMTVVGVTQLIPMQSGFEERNEAMLGRLGVATDIDDASTTVGNYLAVALTDLSAEHQAEYRALIDEELASVPEALATLAALETTADGQATLADIAAKFDSYAGAVARTLALSADDMTAALNSYAEDAIPALEPLDEQVDAYVSIQEQGQRDFTTDAARRMQILLVSMGTIASLTFLAAAIMQVLLSRSIRRQLRQAVSSIGSSASEMLAVASQVAASAAQTAASTNETTATVEEVKQTALLATEKASQVAESSQEVARVAENGRQAVEDTIAGIERMQNQMAVVGQTINRLSEQTQAVGDIISTVNDLAEQSNLLSVNASIEAAKAGDQGKGFTVVAQEVKSLAVQSKQAVAQVRTILSEIQRAGTVAVQAAEEGQEAIERGRQQSLESGEAIYRLAESVTESAQSAVQIAASSRQQLAGMEQISQALDSINAAGAESAKGTRQVEHEVKQLQDLAFRVRRLIDSKATA